MKIGIDIAEIARFEDREDLAKRILSEYEYEEYMRRVDKASYLASRFAVKESYFKASQNHIDYRKIETRKDGDRPVLYIDGVKADAEMSISHDVYAIAVVILLED